MKAKKTIKTDNAPEALGPYSQGVALEDILFLSGQIGIDPKTGTMVEGGVEAQTHQVIKNLEAVLKDADSNLEKVVKTTIYLKDLENFKKVNRVYETYFKSYAPARATVEVSKLPLDAEVEIELIAYR